eukprot:COSAG01_NODE_32912_length_573_cov_0.972574_2_plen_25_part_01
MFVVLTRALWLICGIHHIDIAHRVQ